MSYSVRMSATGRGKRATKKGPEQRTEREPLNNYSTPTWCTKILIARLGFDIRGKRVLEPAAGEGLMAYDLEDAGARVDAVEIDSGRAALCAARLGGRGVTHGDFLSPSVQIALGTYDVVITNPPYSEKVPDGVKKNGKPKFRHRDLALEFVQASLPLAPVVAMLLRLNWAGSLGRQAFHAANPADLIVLSKRPAFVGKGTDATEYAWWIWRRGATIGTWVTDRCLESPRRIPKKVAPVAELGAAAQ